MNAAGYAVWLYGSHARGVPDCYSDLDILVAADRLMNIGEIERHVPLALNGASVSRYTWNELSRMAEYGSLFLHHLKLEAVPLYETPSHRGTLRRVLDELGDYGLAQRDLRGFQVVLDDVAEALDSKEEETYELAVLGTVIRHSTILGCWLLKQPSFGRLEPVSRFVRLRGIESLVEREFPDLYRYRLYTDGRLGRESLRKISGSRWLKRARLIVASVEELARERGR